MTTIASPDLARIRTRAQVTHLKLVDGLVDEAALELAHLLEELGDGVSRIVAPSNGQSPTGGGVPKAKTPRKKRAVRASAPEPAAKPARLSPEDEARAMAERREASESSLPAKVGEGRSARAFTPAERAQVAQYARNHTITDACEKFNLSWPCVRDWIDKHPRSALANAGAAS